MLTVFDSQEFEVDPLDFNLEVRSEGEIPREYRKRVQAKSNENIVCLDGGHFLSGGIP